MKLISLLVILAASTSAALAAATGKAVPPLSTQVFTVSEVDQAPKPMFVGNPVYPAELKPERVAGEVVIECVVDSDGSVRDPVVKSSTRKEFELPALQAVNKSKFRPGVKGKEKVNVKLEQTIKFPAPK